MAIKKVSRLHTDTEESVANAPELEKMRVSFRRAAAHSKQAKDTKTSNKKRSLSRRKIILPAILGLLVALFVGSGVVAYITLSNSPERIVADALVNASTANQASFTIDANTPTKHTASIVGSYADGRAKFTANVQTDLPGDLNKIKADVVATQSTLYVKAPRVSQLIKEIAPPAQQQIASSITSIVQSKIDGKWLMMQSTDASFLQPFTGASSCTSNAARAALTNQKSRKAIADLYLQHAFFTVKQLRAQDGVGTYQLTIDHDRFNTFLDALTSADADVPFSNCTAEISALKKSTIDKAVVELGIDTKSRTLKQVMISLPGKDAQTIIGTVSFDGVQPITEPQDALNFEEVKNPIINILAKSFAG